MTAVPFPPPGTCPTSLIASCAPLLGFTPQDCVVAFAHGVPGRTSPVIVRVDLPAPHATPAMARHTARSIAGTRAVAVDLVAWVTEDDERRRCELSSTPVLAALTDALALQRVDVGVTVSTNGDVWWSHQCSDPRCCPEQATPLDQRVADTVRAEYVFAGYAPLASRAQLARRVAEDPGRVMTVRRALARTSAKPTTRWQLAQIEFLDGLLLAPERCHGPHRPLSASKAARLLRAVAHVRVRDVTLRRLVVAEESCPACWEATIETLCAVLRGAPPGSVAPVATVLALVAWMRGDGALATLCLQRAAEDPDYRLAQLAEALIARGTDPLTWRASVAQLSEAQCLGVE